MSENRKGHLPLFPTHSNLRPVAFTLLLHDIAYSYNSLFLS